MNNLNERDVVGILRLMDLYKLNTKESSNILAYSVKWWYKYCTAIIRYEVQKRQDEKIRKYKKLMKRSNKWFYLTSNFIY